MWRPSATVTWGRTNGVNLLTPLRLSVAELRHRPGRALLPGVALVVGFACLVASLLLTDAFRRAAVQGAPRVPDAVDLVVERARGSLQEDQVDLVAVAQRLEGLPGVQRVVPVQRVELDLLVENGRAGLTDRAVLDVEQPESGLRRFPVAEGRAPQAPDEIAVDRVTAHRYDLRPGSTVLVADVEGRAFPVTVSGISLRGALGERPELVGVPELAARVDTDPVLHGIHLVLQPGHDPATMQAEVLQTAGAGVAVRTAAAVNASEQQARESGVSIFLLFSVLALATAMFVAAATFRAVYLQRQRETALLRCLGAQRGTLVVGRLVEAGVTGAVCGLLGALLGGPFAVGLARLLDVTGVSLLMGVVALEPRPLPAAGYVATAVLLSAGFGTAAALRPALAACGVAPLAALRDAEEPPPERALPRGRLIRGLLVTAGAVVLALAAGALRGSTAALAVVLMSAIAAVAGLFWILGPVVVPGLSRLFGALVRPIGGLTWRLAALEVRRVPHRSASVALPLVAASALITFGLTVMGGITKAVVTEDLPRPDVVVFDSGNRPLPSATLQAAGADPRVAAAAVVHTGRAVLPVHGKATPVAVASAEPEAMRGVLLRAGMAETALADFGTDAALLGRGWARSLRLSVGDRFTVEGLPDGSRTVRYAGELPTSVLPGVSVLFVGSQETPVGPPTSVLVSLHPDADPAAYRDAVLSASSDAPTVVARIGGEADAQAREQLQLIGILFATLLGLSVAVAVAGIGTTLAVSVRERRRELALRRALGVTVAGMRYGVIAEALLLAGVGLLGGGALGVFYAWLTPFVMGLTVIPTAPPTAVVVGAAAVLLLTVLAAAVPARAAARVAPAVALAGE